MPFLDTVEGRSDGGYAVADFRKVQENLGTMEDLESLTAACSFGSELTISSCFFNSRTSRDATVCQVVGPYVDYYAKLFKSL